MSQMLNEVFTSSQEEQMDLQEPQGHFDSPKLNLKDISPSIQFIPLQQEDIWIQYCHQKEINTSTYNSTFSNLCQIDQMINQQKMIDESAIQNLSSFKSCEIYENSISMNDGQCFLTFNSAEVLKGPKNFKDQDRNDKLKRYLDKKTLRNFNKVIRYQSRKKVANDRTRVGGKFQKQVSSTKECSNIVEITPKKSTVQIGKNETNTNFDIEKTVKSKKL